jgi:alkaline phosphatase
MGPQAVGLLNSYAKYAESSVYRPHRVTALESLMAEGTLGMVYHEASAGLSVDSAASATQMASGKWALAEAIGIDRSGQKVVTIFDRAKQLGKGTGLVSDTRLTHATPAAFAAHRPHRSQENEIALDLLDAGVDVMLSGGLRHFIPREAGDPNAAVHAKLKKLTGNAMPLEPKRKDSRNLLEEAKAKGYALAFTRKELLETEASRLLGLFRSSALPYRIDAARIDPEQRIPTLPDMAKKALHLLSNSPKGFVLLVEAGMIDWAAHENDAGALLHEMKGLDRTAKVIHEFVKQRNDTLLIVTADHETGGFSFSYTRHDVPKPTPFPGPHFPDSLFKPNFNFGDRRILDRLYGQKASYTEIFSQFDELMADKSQVKDGAAVLMKLVNENTQFPITRDEAERVLAVEPNQYRVSGHSELDRETYPAVDDFEAFYVYAGSMRESNLARAVATAQNAVWSTGTHTSTPVPLIAIGPSRVIERFGRLMHTTEWAEQVFDILE